MLFAFLPFALSILPEETKKKNNWISDNHHSLGILPFPIQEKLNQLISKITIKFVPERVAKLINDRKTSTFSPMTRNINPAERENKFVVLSSFLIIFIALTLIMLIKEIKQNKQMNNQ
ncbi:hypothetical protein TRFO_42282 [Tritrichomonas foetus]|uniref:Uncharacterized protein n=1 Tax=Tritrichomonas foetus TaxID=1144522 RepID=A0A1J4KX35_9EUKA|nr:hypothetical protein TRFO_42282 [Tritrichomonas foetus]|eukprot:OHT15817.1 hypothetical protein TRFO_42282 [Tritrichomonas foetus]